jgi:hypothetical protein
LRLSNSNSRFTRCQRFGAIWRFALHQFAGFA